VHTLSELIAPTGECFGCTAQQRQQCHDEADLVVSYCMIVRNDATYCTNAGVDYEDNCLAEKGCPWPVKTIDP
jgi:hypothetical protein